MHILFKNAAIEVDKTIENTTFEEWSREVAVDLGDVFLCSKHFLPELRKVKGNTLNMAFVNGCFVEPSTARPSP